MPVASASSVFSRGESTSSIMCASVSIGPVFQVRNSGWMPLAAKYGASTRMRPIDSVWLFSPPCA